MGTKWVYEFDGSVQCAPDDMQQVSTMQESEEKLASLIGEASILNKKSIVLPVITLCGFPKGNAHSFEITEEGHDLLFRGVSGALGFEDLPDAFSIAISLDKYLMADGEWTPWPWLSKSSDISVLPISSLIGSKIRIIEEGKAVTLDWAPRRINIETDSSGNYIKKIYFG